MGDHSDINHAGIPGVGGTGNAGTPYEVDYVEFTSNVTPSATSEATANTVVTASAVSFDGSTVALIEFWAHNARPADAANATLTLVLYDGSSSIGTVGLRASDGGENEIVYVQRRITPSNASHTYSIRAFVNSGTGLVGAGAGGNGNAAPGFIRISKLVG